MPWRVPFGDLILKAHSHRVGDGIGERRGRYEYIWEALRADPGEWYEETFDSAREAARAASAAYRHAAMLIEVRRDWERVQFRYLGRAATRAEQIEAHIKRLRAGRLRSKEVP